MKGKLYFFPDISQIYVRTGEEPSAGMTGSSFISIEVCVDHGSLNEPNCCQTDEITELELDELKAIKKSSLGHYLI